MFIIGACLGSFLCCQARRLHLRESTNKGKHGKRLGPRSICLHCKKQLKWYDNIPIISWIMLRGKCRHCHKKIGILELLSELGAACAFLLISFTVEPSLATLFDWAIFAAATILTVLLVFLAIYDGAYGELPCLCLTLSIICAIILATLRVWAYLSVYPFTPSLICDPLLAISILGGIYLGLYLMSKGRWVGDGDWILGTAIAIALGTPWLALIALFLTNFVACIVMYPLVKPKPIKTKTASRKPTPRKIHLGPFMVTSFILVYSYADVLLTLV